MFNIGVNQLEQQHLYGNGKASFLTITKSVSNYSSFDILTLKFDHSFYSKNYAKYHFFFLASTMILNLTIFE
jgi:hypothetical protein